MQVTTLNDVDAMVLAGGLGTRLRRTIPDRPKALAPIAGRPFITYLLDQLSAAELRSATLCVGYLADQIRTALGSEYEGLPLEFSKEETPLGTAGALASALPKTNSDTIMVFNGDSFCDADLDAFLNSHEARRGSASLLLAKVPDVSRYGAVQVNPDGEITSFDEKSAGKGSGWINAGIYLIERRLLESMPPARPLSLERDVFPGWAGHGLLGVKAAARFIDIGTEDSFQAAQHFFGEGTGP